MAVRSPLRRPDGAYGFMPLQWARREGIGAIVDAGAVNVLYGSVAGLTASGDQLWHQDRPGVKGGAEADELFGFSLARRG